mmetsp:Transcript_1038/g.1679  ORF Transcript_1038/g.1679 Transcript_1038/m.1679 type:complete len:915 (-) Transcript_1038:217-2961(-)|eukprot:CAMPEP_0185036048 /NCGR_PEP_ID=MMETSP1103-20130426/28435_1 /TAXON_ID=36769 /ORGANISM="Paraphysomonas bandaiensis, Strain Caron Lab Isolate" /LENGTH=914 /DNA_ID=CAMNT_0027573417 /DNA_START=146 /DNA_END=2890 /DNA_ORIENTATION=-
MEPAHGSSRSRLDRRKQLSVEILSAVETLELENSVKKKSLLDEIKAYLPVFAWLIWIFIGTLYYGQYVGFGWAKGLYISVNIGWGVNWTVDFAPDLYNSHFCKLFSLIYTSIGTVFLGIIAIFISHVAINKDNWVVEAHQRQSLSKASSKWSLWLALAAFYIPKFSVVIFLIVWAGVGMVWCHFMQPSWTVAQGADFVVSSLTGSGYKSIPSSSPDWVFTTTAIYCSIGVPLMAIGMGLFVSLLIRPSNAALLARLFADVTQEELDFMVSFGIEDGDGMISRAEFVLLMMLRIGSVSPELIGQITARFKELDRRHQGKIAYEDIIVGRRQAATIDQRKAMFARGLSSVNMSSFADAVDNAVSRSSRKVYPTGDCGNDDIEMCNPDTHTYTVISHKYVVSDDSTSGDVENPINQTLSTVPAQQRVSRVSIHAQESENSVRSFDDDQVIAEVEARVRAESDSTLPEGWRFDDDTPDSLNTVIMPRRREVSQVLKFDEESKLKEGQIPNDADDSERLENDDDDALGDLPSLSQNRRRSVSVHVMLGVLRQSAPDTMELTPRFSGRGRAFSDASCRSNNSMSEPVDVNICGNHVFRIESSWCIWLIRMFVENPYWRLCFAWCTWLFAGALFYTFHGGMNGQNSFLKGIYTSISVGVGMFWMTLKYDTIRKVYTIMHMLLGTVAMASMRATVAQFLVESKHDWYVDAVRRQRVAETVLSQGVRQYILAWLDYYGPKGKVHIAFLCFVVIGVVWSCAAVGWSFVDGLYFSLSAMASGGLYSIPADSPDWMYGIVGLYVTMGVPVMAVSFSILAYTAATMGQRDALPKALNTLITEPELAMMRTYGFDNNDGCIDNSEFTVLILVRVGAINPELITVINDWYSKMDIHGTGNVSFEEVQHTHITPDNPQRKITQALISSLP